MSKRWSKISVLLAVVMFVTCFTPGLALAKSKTVNRADQLIFTGVDDTSDLPTWTGKQLKINVWSADSNGGGTRPVSTHDVVTPEVKRVTGVQIDPKKSFDNGGVGFLQTYTKVVATKNWPHVISGGDPTELAKMAKAGLLYDLSSYYKKYCPNLMKALPQDKLPLLWSDFKVNLGYSGKVYGLPTGAQGKWAPVADPTIDRTKFAVFYPEPDAYPYMLVRDDVIKKLYPNARTQDEIEALYMKNGKFTAAEVFDIPLNSKQDFISFLKKIKDLNLEENGKKVYPIFTSQGAGSDNWPLFADFGIWGNCPTINGWNNPNYYTYFNKKTQKIDLMYQQPFFKEWLKDANYLLKEGLASKEAFLDDGATLQGKLDQGLYAVSYAWYAPDASKLEAAGKKFRYRKVYLNIAPDYNNFIFTGQGPNAGAGFTYVLKSKVSEKDLIQLLKFYDYCASEAGQKLNTWGPKSAGLWTVQNGRRVFKDKNLEKAMVERNNNIKGVNYVLKYNLQNGSIEQINNIYYNVPQVYAFGRNKFSPSYVYPTVRKKGDANVYFASGFVKSPLKLVPSNGMNAIWDYTGKLPEVDKYWKTRTTVIEADITKIISSETDADFEKYYKQLMEDTVNTGLTQDVLNKMDKLYKETNKYYLPLYK